MYNFTRDLSLLPTAQLNTALAQIGEPLANNKSEAVSALARAIHSGRITLDQVKSVAPTQSTKVALEPSVPDEIRKKILNTQFEVAKAVEGVKNIEQVANNLLDTVHKDRVANEKKLADLSVRLSNDIQALQGVDYGKVENAINERVSKLFDSFRKVTSVEEITTIANALPKCERKRVKDVFNGVLHYEHNGETIDFSNDSVDVWGDVNAPALVDDYVFNPKHLHQALIALDDPLPDNVWLAGERSTGKSTFVEQVASRLGRRLFRINFDEAIERSEFIGGNKIGRAHV